MGLLRLPTERELWPYTPIHLLCSCHSCDLRSEEILGHDSSPSFGYDIQFNSGYPCHGCSSNCHDTTHYAASCNKRELRDSTDRRDVTNRQSRPRVSGWPCLASC